jgi:hypothetical protein
MPNVLVLSLEGFSFSARQLYEQLLPKLLSRAIVHESLTIQDALNYIHSEWPSVILVTDAVIAAETPDSQRLLKAVTDITSHGCTTILMGFFVSSIDAARITFVLNNFGVRWEAGMSGVYDATLAIPDENSIRLAHLPKSFRPEAVWLRRVPPAQAVYVSSYAGTTFAYAALGRVGLGKLGYVGDVNFAEEAERVILAMCHLDRPDIPDISLDET